MALRLAAVGGSGTAVAPGPVIGLAADPRNGAAALAWVAPVAAGTSPVASYTVTATTGGIVRSYSVPATRTSMDAAQLINDLTWAVTVTAVSAAGASPATGATVVPSASAPNPADPVQPVAKVPGAPVLTSVDAGNAGAVVAWSAPVDNGGATLTTYRVTAVGPTGVPVVALAAGDVLTETLTRLTNGVTYSVTVAAVDVAGTGPTSNTLTVTPTDAAPDVGQPPVVTPVDVTPPAEPVLAAFPASFPLAPAFFLATPEQAADILAAQILEVAP
jgi:hypothetical protein